MTTDKKTRNKNINVPNALSIVRIFLIPPFIIYFLGGKILEAAIILILSGLSDLFDGVIARNFDQKTEIGQVLDPLADKLTQGAVVVCLAVEQPVLIPLLAIFILKELLMLAAAGFLILRKKKRPSSSKWYGKVATVLFYISFCTIVALRGIWGFENLNLTFFLLSVTAVFMLYALAEYAKIFFTLLRSTDPKDDMDLKADIKARKIKK